MKIKISVYEVFQMDNLPYIFNVFLPISLISFSNVIGGCTIGWFISWKTDTRGQAAREIN